MYKNSKHQGDDSIVKNKYQLLSYIFIFFAGYYSNFLFSNNLSFIQSSSLSETEVVKSSGNKNREIDKDTSLNIVSSDKKAVASDFKSEPGSVVPPLIAADSLASVKPEELSAIHNELAMLRDYRMQTEINKRNEYLQSLGGGTIDALNNNFEREPIDSAWAREKEILINNVIGKSEHLSQLPHLGSECRSKQCKFSVLSDDQFYLDKLSSSLEKIVAEHDTSFSSYSIVVDDKSHTTSIYFDRN